MDGAVAETIAALRLQRRRTLATQIGTVVAVVLLVLGSVLVLDARVTGAIDELRRLANEAAGQAAAADQIGDALTVAETSQRGYLLTRQQRFLPQYETAVAEVQTTLETLDRLGTRAPWLRDAAADLHVIVGAKLAELRRTVQLARAGDRDAAARVVLEGAGERLAQDARQAVTAIVARAGALRDERLADLHAREREAANGIVVISAIGLMLLGFAAVILLAARDRLAMSETALRTQSERLAITIANLRDGVVVFDAADRLLQWNMAFFAATGLPTSLAARGTPFSRFAEAASVWSETPLAARRPGSVPLASQVVSGARTIDLWRAAMPDGGQMLAAIDVTSRVAADASARQSSKMEALGQLTGGVAHDFNNLLQVVSSNLELLQRQAPPGESASRNLAAALAGVDRAAQLTRHLLAFARRQTLAPATIDPGRLLQGMGDMLRRTLGETIAVEVTVANDVWPIRADPQLLENAVLNLALNARDAMPEGGHLTLSADNAVVGVSAGHPGEIDPGEYVVLSVRDDGHGMSPETLTRAIEPFFTTKPEGSGTGLGLPMVFGFARQSGGNLELASAVGEGTTSRLYIPRSHAAADAPTAPPVRPGRLDAAASDATVLIVEDDDVVRAATVQALRSLGYSVIEAANAAAALALLRGGLRPDILFTDVVMPGQPSVLDLADEARRLHPRLAVLFTSGYADNPGDAAAPHDATIVLLKKPWRIDDLQRHLAAVAPAEPGSASPTMPPPAASALAPPTVPSSGGAPGCAPRTRRRATLVEDDVMVRMVTADLLGELNYDVTSHATGAGALRALRATGTDLLVTDIGLPDMNGLDVARQAVELLPDLAVVIASGVPEGASEGFTVLEKPYDAARLRRAVARAVGSSREAAA